MARSNCDYECDWPTCSGCPHDHGAPVDIWQDPDYPEYDPADDYDLPEDED